MENIKETIAANLCALRKQHRLTQQELATRLNYSDKAISRWERAESLPDIETLCKVCDIYGVRFEYLLQKEQPQKNNPYILDRRSIMNEILITLIAVLSVWIAATVAFTYMNIILGQDKWIFFIWAIPLSSFVCSMCNRFLFKNRIFKHVCTSVTLWGIILSIYLELLSFNIWMLFIVGVPLQMIIILTALLRTKKPSAHKSIGSRKTAHTS